ncbi:hypothetical protein P3W24_06430 [Luteibacter sp. PPL201]|uniref:Cellulase Ig-like domain-containing protein n=1 Tax=Luteibacter sahnii TaxID=3021977 RepID=A0ABT6B8Z3_9GAMM|nr:hypothetical protein [Luteibacter sp. PPL193]MDY1549509.1 hypothetical protein [Luteibacter sp. PPL193]
MRSTAVHRRDRHVTAGPPVVASRRALLVLGGVLALASLAGSWGARSVERLPADQRIEVTRGAGQGDDLPVSVGIPLPPGRLRDPGMVRIVDAKGAEVPAAVTPMLAWHVGDGGWRAVRAQFRGPPGRYYFLLDARRESSRPAWPFAQGVIDGHAAALATLTPEWLTRSLIAGPQRVAAPGEAYAAYVDGQFRWAKALPDKDTTAWLFDRPSTLFKAYVRTGRADYLDAAEASYRWYMAGLRREGAPASPTCAGGWMPDGKPCDVKYVYIEPIVMAVALTGDDSMHDAALVTKMATLWANGGWNGAPGPYRHPDDYFTERLAGLGLVETVAAFELTGDPLYLRRVRERVGWLQAHQAANPDGLGDDGSWRNSWNVHENDRGGKDDVRGASPWMSENIIDGLWHAWLVTKDPRIPDMIVGFGLYLERYGWIDPDRLVPPHDWRNGCSGPNGQIAWYWSSSTAPPAALVRIQASEGWYSDGHTVELGLPVAAAYYFAHDAAQAATFRKRFEAIASSYAPACAAIGDTLRRFNWNNRGAGVAQWMMHQPPGAGRAP